MLRRVEFMHFDVKPDNIICDNNMEMTKLTDFGSVVEVRDAKSDPGLGPRYYRSPEVMLGQPPDCAVDMWAAGCTIFELSTGQILFKGENNTEMFQAHLEVLGPYPVSMRSSRLWSSHFTEAGDLRSADGTSMTPRTDFPKTSLEERFDPGTPKWLIDIVRDCLHPDPTMRLKPMDGIARFRANSTS